MVVGASGMAGRRVRVRVGVMAPRAGIEPVTTLHLRMTATSVWDRAQKYGHVGDGAVQVRTKAGRFAHVFYVFMWSWFILDHLIGKS